MKQYECDRSYTTFISCGFRSRETSGGNLKGLRQSLIIIIIYKSQSLIIMIYTNIIPNIKIIPNLNKHKTFAPANYWRILNKNVWWRTICSYCVSRLDRHVTYYTVPHHMCTYVDTRLSLPSLKYTVVAWLLTCLHLSTSGDPAFDFTRGHSLATCY
jgi:hypothetical protein